MIYSERMFQCGASRIEVKKNKKINLFDKGITKHLENTYPDAFLIQRNGGNQMVVGNFTVDGREYVVVRMENAIHIMSKVDWRWVYDQLHLEKNGCKQYQFKGRKERGIKWWTL